jgi:hypothetical protein
MGHQTNTLQNKVPISGQHWTRYKGKRCRVSLDIGPMGFNIASVSSLIDFIKAITGFIIFVNNVQTCGM